MNPTLEPPLLEQVIEPRRHDLGGFEVDRVLPFQARRMVGPFVFFDRMGPHRMQAPVPRSTDVRPHPHIGLSTVTYLFEGEMTHRDSTGATQVIRPGALNWMTAGSGIVHSERFDGMRETGGPIDGIQSWVALPREDEEDAPSFEHYDVDVLPSGDEAGVSLRLIAGEAYGLRSPARTHSPLFYVHVEMQPGARVVLPAEYAERAVYVARGQVRCDGQQHDRGRLLVFRAGGAPEVQAVGNTRLMLLGGEPVGERFLWWNFVSSSRERIEQAKADWAAGRMRLPPGDDAERIPLPPDARATSPNPMS
ncbi:MAG: pirin family protein [Burkholderiaceae bacterium]|nr:pirin family protein [Burkholderiaceae bacterium]